MTGKPSPLGTAEQCATDSTAAHENGDTAASPGSRCLQEVPSDTSGPADGLTVLHESEHELWVAAADQDSRLLNAASQPQPLQMHSAAAPDGAEAMDGLRSAADCEEFLRQLPGGRRALTQIADLTRGLNSRTECLDQVCALDNNPLLRCHCVLGRDLDAFGQFSSLIAPDAYTCCTHLQCMLCGWVLRSDNQSPAVQRLQTSGYGMWRRKL